MLRAQVCQSPFRSHFKAGGTHTVDTYGYNLIWYGTHGPWSTMWSANMMELQEGRFISYLALGNELRLGKQASLQLDYMNRAAAHQTYFFRDCMVMGQLSYRPSEKFNLFAKACYDVNNTDNAEDLCVMAGTELTRFDGGVEYYPLGLHALHAGGMMRLLGIVRYGVSAVKQGNKPLDILICYAGYLALVEYRQQCNLDGFIFALYDVIRNDSCPAALTLAFRSNGHAYLVGSATQVCTLERVLA